MAQSSSLALALKQSKASLNLQKISLSKHQGNSVIFQIESTFLRLSHLCFVPRAWVGTCFDSISRLLSVCPSSYCTPHTAQLPKSFSIYVLGFPSKIDLYVLEQYLNAISGLLFSQQWIMIKGWDKYCIKQRVYKVGVRGIQKIVLSLVTFFHSMEMIKKWHMSKAGILQGKVK